MILHEIETRLRQMREEGYGAGQAKLIPTVAPDHFLGIRTPPLRSYARELVKRPDVDAFLQALPHRYFDEDQLHAFILSEMKDFDRCVEEVGRFLPFVDNWATSDQLSPKCFKKHRQALLPHIQRWIDSGETYPVRFGVGMLMQHYLDEDFDPGYLKIVADIRSEAYYVNMMRAWYFATALAKQYETTAPYIERKALDSWTHNKAIQKAVESFRVPVERKEYLKSLRIRSK